MNNHAQIRSPAQARNLRRTALLLHLTTLSYHMNSNSVAGASPSTSPGHALIALDLSSTFARGVATSVREAAWAASFRSASRYTPGLRQPGHERCLYFARFFGGCALSNFISVSGPDLFSPSPFNSWGRMGRLSLNLVLGGLTSMGGAEPLGAPDRAAGQGGHALCRHDPLRRGMPICHVQAAFSRDAHYAH